MCLLAVFGSVGAEACEVELTDLFPDVLLRAVGSEGTETFFVVWTWWETGRRVDVEIEAFICRVNISVTFMTV